MNSKVANQDFKRWKKICLRCLNENQSISEKLDKFYRLISVYFFYEVTDPHVSNIIREALADPSLPCPSKPVPAAAYSRKNRGCIVIFLKHFKEHILKRTDIADFGSYIKNGLFEEFCHLVEQEGDSTEVPDSYIKLGELYQRNNLLSYGNQILLRLDTDRNHYTVYLMMLRAYPNDWVKRYSKYFHQTPEQYEQQYEQWKNNIPISIVYARLVTDYFRMVNLLYVAKKAYKEPISVENKKLLDSLIVSGKKDVEGKRHIIDRDMGQMALSLIDCINEPIFKTPKIFFSVMLDLWKNLKLV